MSASLLIPHPDFINKKYSVEIIHRPSVLDNNNNWQVFKDDAHINAFLQSVEKFSMNYFEGSHVECKKIFHDLPNENEVLQLKGNVISKGLVELEFFFL